MAIGDGQFFRDGVTEIGATALNALNRPGFVYQSASEIGTLNVSVGPVAWLKAGPALNEYAGSSGNAIPASVTRYLYLDSSNVLQTSSSLPTIAADNFLLAKVVTNGSQVTSITQIGINTKAAN